LDVVQISDSIDYMAVLLPEYVQKKKKYARLESTITAVGYKRERHLFLMVRFTTKSIGDSPMLFESLPPCRNLVRVL